MDGKARSWERKRKRKERTKTRDERQEPGRTVAIANEEDDATTGGVL